MFAVSTTTRYILVEKLVSVHFELLNMAAECEGLACETRHSTGAQIHRIRRTG